MSARLTPATQRQVRHPGGHTLRARDLDTTLSAGMCAFDSAHSCYALSIVLCVGSLPGNGSTRVMGNSNLKESFSRSARMHGLI